MVRHVDLVFHKNPLHMFHIFDSIKIFFYLGQFVDQSSPFGSQDSNWDLGLNLKIIRNLFFGRVSELGLLHLTNQTIPDHGKISRYYSLARWFI